MNYCVICYEQSNHRTFNRVVTGVCRELARPVCAKHARYCDEDGHGTIPWPIQRDKSPTPAPQEEQA